MNASADGNTDKCEQVLILTESKVINDLYNGHSALHAASHNGNLECIRVLLKHKANIELEVKVLEYKIKNNIFLL